MKVCEGTGLEPRRIKRWLTWIVAAAVLLSGCSGILFESKGGRGTSESLKAVWASSETDAFAVGLGGTVLHYDGTSWQAMASGWTDDLFAVWGASSTDVFAVGELGRILHYDGSTWESMAARTNTTPPGRRRSLPKPRRPTWAWP